MKKSIIFTIVISLCFASFISTACAKTTSTVKSDNSKGTWLWNTELILKQEKDIISYLSKNKIGDLYLQVNPDIPIDNYKKFIENASKNNIKVYALDGAKDWILKEKQDKLDNFFNWVEAYNTSASKSQKFSGVHLDVEPYLLSLWKEDMATAILYYQDYITKASAKCNELNLPFGVDMPFWFDGRDFSNSYGKDNLAKWVIEKCDSINIMAYRDKSANIIDIVSNEMEWAKQLNKKLVISVEIGKSSEGNFVSFYEEGQSYMYKELNKVKQHYENQGLTPYFAIHYLEILMKTK